MRCPPGMPIQDRLFAKRKIVKGPEPTPCWIWQGYTKDGYGQIRFQKKTHQVHRISYLISCGPITEGLELDHLCNVSSCFNPDHLEPVTHKINCSRANNNLYRKVCVNGHKLNKKNTRYSKDKGWAKTCLECKRNRDKAWSKRNRAHKAQYLREWRKKQKFRMTK